MQTKIQKAKLFTLQSRISELQDRSLTPKSAQARTIHTYLHLVRQIVESNKHPKKKSEPITQIRASRNQKLDGYGKRLSVQCRYQYLPLNSKKAADKRQQFRIYNAKGFRKNTISLPNKFATLQKEKSHEQPQRQINFIPIGSLYQQNKASSFDEREQQKIIFSNKSQILSAEKYERKDTRRKILIRPINSFFRNLVKSDFKNSNYKNISSDSITNNSEYQLLSKSALYMENSSQLDSPMPW